MTPRKRITPRRPGRAAARSGVVATLALAVLGGASGLPIGASAQEAATTPASYRLPVSAGEHDGFSRLVLQRPRGAAWEIVPIERGVEVRFDKAGFDFDQSAVIDRRMAHRVVGMETVAENGRTVLRFDFNCDCSVDSETLGGRNLKLDITPRRTFSTEGVAVASIDDPSLEDAAQASVDAAAESEEAPALDTAAQVARAQRALLEQLQRAADQGLIAFRNDADPQEEDAAPAAPEAPTADYEIEPQPPVEPTTPVAADDGDPSPTPETRAEAIVEDAREASAETVADEAAATSGAPATVEGVPELIQVLRAAQSDDPVAALEALARAQTEEEAAAEAQQTPPTTAAAGLVSPLAREAETVSLDALSEAEAGACLADADVDPHRWRGVSPFFDELSRLRRVLFDASYLVDDRAVVALSRFYLAHGLAEEAQAASRSFGVANDQTRLVDAMADVARGRPPHPGSPFARLEPCPGRHGVWQAAALSEIAPDAAMAAYDRAEHVLASFQPPYRRVLGARIARAAAATGDIESAIDVLELLRRNSEPPTPEMLWAEAELELEHGSTLRGRRVLEEIIALRRGGAPRAAALLADSYGVDAPIDEVARTTAILDDFSLQYRGSSIGARVVEAQAALVARFGDLPGAARILRREAASSPRFAGRLAEKRRELIRADIAAALVEPTSERLSAALKAAELLSPTEGEAIRLALAETLIENDAHALAALALPPTIAARSEQARDVLARAAEASRLTPAIALADAAERPIEALRRTAPPPMEPMDPVGSGRAILDAVDKELELLREIARP